MPESPTNEVVVSASSLDPPFLKCFLPWLYCTCCQRYSKRSFLRYLERSEPKQHPRNRERRLIQDGFHGMYLEEKEAQTKTRDAGDVRDTKNINLCSRAQKEDKYAPSIHGESASKATTLIS